MTEIKAPDFESLHVPRLKKARIPFSTQEDLQEISHQTLLEVSHGETAHGRLLGPSSVFRFEVHPKLYRFGGQYIAGLSVCSHGRQVEGVSNDVTCP